MRLFTSDYSKTVDVGTGSIWNSIYSTAITLLSENIKRRVPLAIEFLKTGSCNASIARETRIQLMAIHNAFLAFASDAAVYDWHKPTMPAPWKGHIAPSVTSCANLYTTAEGKDLFKEVLNLLEYAERKSLDISAE